MKEKMFAFMVSTPDFAKLSDCGQFNGYVGIPMSCKESIYETQEDYSWHSDYDTIFSTTEEITYAKPFNEIMHKEAIPVIGTIPSDLENWFILGFDTCHIYNSWKEDDENRVREKTFKFFEEIKEQFPEK